jgi:hypothetical protein
MTREYRRAKKEFMYSIIVGDYYAFKVYKVTDAALNVYWIGSPVGRGGTVLADKEEDIRPQLEKQVPILNSFLARVK